ncbi:MAG: acyl-CoA thioesterase [Chthoniobacterales bacterium]
MEKSSPPRPFEIVVAVAPADIDEQGHVNNTVYLRWIQEVTTAHWTAIASRAVQETIGWVVLRHEIDYKSPALPGEEVLLRTWVGRATRMTFERFTEIRRKGDTQLLSQARTVWCPINTATGRPTRVPAEVRAQFSSDE